MSSLHTTFSHLRIMISYGPGLMLLLLLHETIRLQRPDIVDQANRVKSIDPDLLLDEYDFIGKTI